jgi:outer membrane protein TolC
MTDRSLPSQQTRRSIRLPRARRALFLAAMSALGLIGVGGCSNEPPIFDPRGMEMNERRHAQGVPTDHLSTYPTTLEATPTPKGAIGPGSRPATQAYLQNISPTGRTYSEKDTIPLTLREVITRTVLYNADVKVAGYDPAINSARVLENEAAFDVSAFINLRTERNDPGLSTSNVGGNQLLGFTDKTKSEILEAGFKQKLPWGGDARLFYSLSWNEVDNLGGAARQRFWQNQLRAEITQPLLQNYGRDVNAARIEISRQDVRISLLDFRKALEEQLSEVERAYWQLYQAVKIVEIQEILLTETIETYRVLRDRFERGLDISEISVAQANASVKARQADLIRAKQNVRDLSDEIKRRMGDPAFPISSDLVIFPAEDPVKEPIEFDYAAAIDAATFNRFELGQQRARIEQARIAERVAVNNKLPRLDLVTRFGVTGVGITTGEAIKNNDDFNSPNWTFGIEFEYPIENRAARAILLRARLQRSQAVEQYRSLLQQTTLDVRVALNDIKSSWEQSIARQQSRLASRRQLNLIQHSQDVGEKLDLAFVQLKLQAQEELANAAREEVSALANYNIAIQRLERAKGTLLKYNNVQLREDPGQTFMRRAWVEDDAELAAIRREQAKK